MNTNSEELYTVNDDGEIVLIEPSPQQYQQPQNQPNFQNNQFSQNPTQSFPKQVKNFQNKFNGPPVSQVSPMIQNNQQYDPRTQRINSSQRIVQPTIKPNFNNTPVNNQYQPQKQYQQPQYQQQYQPQQQKTYQTPYTPRQTPAPNSRNVSQLNQQESLSYNNWKKLNLNLNQMVQPNGQIHSQPQYDNFNPNQDNEVVQNTNFTQLSNRARHGTFISNNSNVYQKYSSNLPPNIKSSLAIRKARNSESSFM
jgi:hypothetical protein